jgi:hypothetical protein
MPAASPFGMRTEQFVAPTLAALIPQLTPGPRSAELVLVFADNELLADPALPALLAEVYPGAAVVGCTGSGQIHDDGARLDGVVVTAVGFDRTRVAVVTTTIADAADSAAAGRRLAQGLAPDGLAAVVVLVPGLDLNGSEVVAGMRAELPSEVTVSGGLAGDRGEFRETMTLAGTSVGPRQLVGIGLYGAALITRVGSRHGWRPLGALRRVTRCDRNVLHELDGEPALDLYRRYLGDYADGLPATALLFPFEIVSADCRQVGPIRTVLDIDRTTGTVTLAGDVDPDGYLRMMHATNDSLIVGAEAAAAEVLAGADHGLALLVSCIGRRLVMGDDAESEIEAVRATLGPRTRVAGFYSFGEIAPSPLGASHLHNQTLTITYLTEGAEEAP